MCIECKCTEKIFINDIYAHIMVGWFTIYLLLFASSITSPVPSGNAIIDPQNYALVMEKSPVFSKARASGLTRALKLITRAFPGFANPIDFTNVTDLIGLYRVQSTIVKCFKVIGSFLVFNIVILRVFISKMLICFHN